MTHAAQKLVLPWLLPAVATACASAEQRAPAPPGATAATAAAEPAPQVSGAPQAPHVSADIAARLEAGRAHLEAGAVEAALAEFEAADRSSGGSLRTRTFVLRAWLSAGRLNDALDAIDELARVHPAAVELDYLYGLAFAAIADQKLASGVADSTLGMNFEDAYAALAEATAADPELSRDAFLPLAHVAYYAQPPRLPEARAAADEAVRRYPQRAECHYQRGEIAFSQYSVASGDPGLSNGDPQAAEQHWQAARESFERAAELADLAGRARDPYSVALAARAALQLGHLHKWKDELERASDAYARALALAPGVVDFPQLWGSLGASVFQETVERGAEGFRARHTDTDPGDATLLWWLGYARMRAQEHERAESAFAAALAKWPAYLDCHYYIARTRFARGDARGASAALIALWDADPVLAIQTLQGDLELGGGMMAAIVGADLQDAEALRARRESSAAAARLESTAAVARYIAEAQPEEPSPWSNLGLVLRDRGDALGEAESADEAARSACYEASYEAYSRALALAPDDPDVLNDTAVVLHYNLGRELPRALELYERALAQASARLEQRAANLTQADKDHLIELQQWARNNIELVKRRIAESAAPAPAGS
jgi:outer membrane protein assembly factor BamD (BamD/ComL family)